MQSEYGWATDSVLLDLPICTARQKIELIQQRREADAILRVKIAEWQTKNISGMLVGLAQDKAQAKAMRDHVEKMSLDLFGEEESRVDNRSIEEIIEQGAIINEERLPSFERMSSIKLAPPKG